MSTHTGKIDPCLSALEWFVYHTRRYTSARIFYFIYTPGSLQTRLTTQSCWRIHRTALMTALTWI